MGVYFNGETGPGPVVLFYVLSSSRSNWEVSLFYPILIHTHTVERALSCCVKINLLNTKTAPIYNDLQSPSRSSLEPAVTRLSFLWFGFVGYLCRMTGLKVELPTVAFCTSTGSSFKT